MSVTSGLSLTTEVVASQQQISCDVADEAVLLSMQTGQYYGLNPVAASIWRLVQEARTVGDIIDTLMLEYEGVTVEECTEAVLSFLSELIALELVDLR